MSIKCIICTVAFSIGLISIHLTFIRFRYNVEVKDIFWIVGLSLKPLVVEAKFRKRANSRTESAKIRNRRLQKKNNGTPTKPRLSVFCSDKQLYAMLVDDVNKKCLFYGSTLQKSVRRDPDVSTAEAAKAVGEELVKAAVNLNIDEISCYDRNGCVHGERVEAFEIALSEHGFLLR